MVQHEARLLFLKEFTRELILNTKPAKISYREQEVFEIPEEPILPMLPEQQYEKIIRTQFIPFPVIMPAIPQPKTVEISQEIPGILMPGARTREIGDDSFVNITRELQTPKPRQRPFPMRSPINFPHPAFTPTSQGQQVQPQTTNLPPDFNLEKLNFLVSDPRVTLIECPGPDKLIVARTFGKPNVTKLSLTQDEIKNILETFSKEAKIPIISGLFKAAVGNLIITAVISDIVGSRFIITKITPAFVIEQINKGF